MTTYDYVIVGAGSAGCVLAHRLSQDPGVAVLLIEAGGADKRWDLHVPAAFSRLYRSKYDWAYSTEAQTNLDNRQVYVPRGKVLGGSSSINAMIYTRGTPYDYDLWRDLGNPGWGFFDVLPYFKRAENHEGGESRFHGVGGPLNVATLRDINLLTRAFVTAGIELGFEQNDDFSGPRQAGVGFHQVTQRNGQRCSTADAYLKPIGSRPNLTVLTHTIATRLVIDHSRVVGVDCVRHGVHQHIIAQREVILACGAIASPQLLMLSGIGPADQLTPLGIPVVEDLPGVGQNLQDHLGVLLTYHCTQPVSLVNAEKPGSILRYLLFKQGPLTSNISEGGAFVSTRPDLPAPDLQIGFVPAYAQNRDLPRPAGHFFSIGCTFLRPLSRGYVGLRSSDPTTPPIIQPNYLSQADDLLPMVSGFKLCRQFIQATAFAPFRGAEVDPGIEIQSNDAIVEYIRGSSMTVDHPVGTCKLGADSMAVVDAELRVRGINGLRIVDASIMPTLVSGNTNAPVIMIAEKAADLIRGLRPEGRSSNQSHVDI